MTIYIRRGSPYWWIDLVPADGGKRVQKSTKIRHNASTPTLRREAKRLAQNVEHEEHLRLAKRLHGEPEPKPACSFREFSIWYEKHITAHHRGHVREVEILENLRKHFGRMPLSEVSRDSVREWITARRDTVRASTVNRELDVLKHLLAAAVPKYLDVSPISDLKRLRVEKRSMVVLSPADETKLYAELELKDQAVVIAALDTLARAGELLALRWQDDHGTYLTILNPKAGDSRKVPVSKRLRAALDPMKKAARGKGYIFAHRRVGKDARTWSNSLKQMLEDGCRRAKITYGREADGITFHGLRHTGATRMIEGGVSLRIVQAIGGWSDLRMLTRYTHPSDDAMRAAVELVSR